MTTPSTDLQMENNDVKPPAKTSSGLVMMELTQTEVIRLTAKRNLEELKDKAKTGYLSSP